MPGATPKFRENPTWGIRVPVYTASDPDRAREEPRESMLAFYQRQSNLMISRLGDEGVTDPEGARRRAEALAQLTYDEVLDSRVVFGTPDEVIGQFENLKEELAYPWWWPTSTPVAACCRTRSCSP